MFSRRDMLAASAMGAAMTVSAASAGSFGNPDEPPEGAINAKNPASVTDPGPQDPRSGISCSRHFLRRQPTLAACRKSGPPSTPCKRASRTAAGHGKSPGGLRNFKEISGVNMRLTAGDIRELHWHQAAEWAYMTYGHCRVTVIDPWAAPMLPTSKRAISGIFPPVTRIPCRVWDRTVANLLSASMTASKASSTLCW